MLKKRWKGCFIVIVVKKSKPGTENYIYLVLYPNGGISESIIKSYGNFYWFKGLSFFFFKRKICISESLQVINDVYIKHWVGSGTIQIQY